MMMMMMMMMMITVYLHIIALYKLITMNVIVLTNIRHLRDNTFFSSENKFAYVTSVLNIHVILKCSQPKTHF